MIEVTLFLILNFLLLLPRFFLNKKTSTFFPVKEFFVDGKFRITPLMARFNDDIFRINLEYTIVVLLLVVFKSAIPIEIAKFVLGVCYTTTLIIFYYHYSIYSIYKTYPAISTDINLIEQGLKIGYNGFKAKFIFGIVVFVVFLIALWLLNTFLLSILYEKKVTVFIVFCVVILIATISFCLIKKINPFRFNTEFDFHYLLYFSIQMTTFVLLANRFFNKKAKEDIRNIPLIIKNSVLPSPNEHSFSQKPNIYFIALESYGAILYENEIYSQKYKILASQIDKSFSENGWQTASSLSNSTVTGGKSWVAYSSFLKGINIKSDAIYRQLFYNQSKYKTQSIFDILETIGYENYLIAGLGGFENYKIEWDEILEFLGTKNVIKYKDLEYKGIRFNLGPSAPDQYLLNKSIQLIKEHNPNKPISFFVETINSHYPFDSPTQLFKNWEDCNVATSDVFKTIKNQSSNQIENYFTAIKYQLKVIEDLILKKDSDAIFIVFGDHQPPILTNKDNSYQTPIHIISKNKIFIKNWIANGFQNSMYCNKEEIDSDLSHHQIKKMFVENYLKTYQEKKL